MASWTFQNADDFLADLSKLENTETIFPKMLEEAAPIVAEKMKTALATHKQTGAMINSVKPSKTKNAKNGGKYLVISPTGSSKKQLDKNGREVTRKTAVRNMEKLAILEYGKDGQAATPVIASVVSATAEAVQNKMEEVYFREAGIK